MPDICFDEQKKRNINNNKFLDFHSSSISSSGGDSYFEFVFNELPKYSLSIIELKNDLSKNLNIVFPDFDLVNLYEDKQSQSQWILIDKKEKFVVCCSQYKLGTSLYLSSSKDFPLELLEKINKYKQKTGAEKLIGLIISAQSLYIQDFEIKIAEVNIKNNYGQNFSVVHDNIVNKLNQKQSGLYLFHGPPGTGKTSYIKHLITLVNRKFIFIPSSEIQSLTNPQIVSVLAQEKDSILVLEDAEKAIVSRDIDSSCASLVSSILNFSDGILGSLFNISIILTFNSKKEKIDNALTRKGRLLIEHEFNLLTKEEAIIVAKSLDKDYTKIKEEKISLADIYNLNENNFHEIKETKKIGFFNK